MFRGEAGSAAAQVILASFEAQEWLNDACTRASCFGNDPCPPDQNLRTHTPRQVVAAHDPPNGKVSSLRPLVPWLRKHPGVGRGGCWDPLFRFCTVLMYISAKLCIIWMAQAGPAVQS